MEYGEPIRVDGAMSAWLNGDAREKGQLRHKGRWFDQGGAYKNWAWDDVDAIRFTPDHPAYTVQRYNAEHGTSFVYWPGGDSAPGDWDYGDVLTDEESDGCIYNGGSHDWNAKRGPKIIGYTRQPATSDTETVTLWKMSELEALEAEYCLPTVRRLGLIRSPTRAETIAAKSGVAVDVVERVLGVMGDE